VTDQLYLWPEDQPGDRLSWSLSKDRRLKECRRKYYLQHYVSRGGGGASASAEARDAYHLKYLRNRHMWVGEIVHEMIELALAALRRGDDATVDALVERGTRRMRAQYAESIQGVYRDRPAVACGLIEHEYREEVPRDEWKRQRDRMEHCLRNFFELELVTRLRSTPPWRWLAVEALSSFDFDGATILVKPDFAWRDDGDRVVVVDWKTGKPRSDVEKQQLAVYGLFARRVWGRAGDALAGNVIHLETGDSELFDISPQDSADAEATIRASLKEMRALHPEALATPFNWDRFPLTDDLTACGRCAFRRLCHR
jgi:hypothetical protein